jgi:hypothetical protein
MYIDFIDIGTSDFRYTIPKEGECGIYVEPIKFYLDKIPDYDCTKKFQGAVMEKRTVEKIYYLNPDILHSYALPYFLRGCNRIGEVHPAIIRECKHKSLDYSKLISISEVSCITMRDLVNVFSVDRVGVIKIDIEGYDCQIVQQVVELVKEGIPFERVIFEAHPDLTNRLLLQETKLCLLNSGFLMKKNIDLNHTNKFDMEFYLGEK